MRGNLTAGKDVEFDINVLLEGDVTIGNHCHIGANVILRNVKIGNHVDIKDNSVIEDAVIGNDCRIGPFARIRPGTVLGNAVHVLSMARHQYVMQVLLYFVYMIGLLHICILPCTTNIATCIGKQARGSIAAHSTSQWCDHSNP